MLTLRSTRRQALRGCTLSISLLPRALPLWHLGAAPLRLAVPRSPSLEPSRPSPARDTVRHMTYVPSGWLTPGADFVNCGIGAIDKPKPSFFKRWRSKVGAERVAWGDLEYEGSKIPISVRLPTAGVYTELKTGKSLVQLAITPAQAAACYKHFKSLPTIDAARQAFSLGDPNQNVRIVQVSDYGLKQLCRSTKHTLFRRNRHWAQWHRRRKRAQLWCTTE